MFKGNIIEFILALVSFIVSGSAIFIAFNTSFVVGLIVSVFACGILWFSFCILVSYLMDLIAKIENL